MTSTPEAELEKLAHQVSVDVEELAFLSAVPADDLRALRGQISEALFQADRHHFVKVAALSKSIPSALAAKITEFALPPMIAARTSELLDPAKAVDMVGRLSERYLANVSAVMDPARSPHIIEQIPPERIAMVARELAARQEWVVIGGFVSVVSIDGLRSSVAAFTGEQLLRIGFVLDDTARLGEISAMLTDIQVDELLAAAAESELWRELDELVANIDEAQAARLVERLAGSPDEVRAGLTGAPLSSATTTKLGLSGS
ncbi:hypothetical protein [Jatrophihabitans sp.]|uniref:hypothetical protein n=1 Tax=Jatrophihabitans sp. TaxID=1932789 RepID=UPI0030C6DE02|nr:hypothetical protein [Jatrophihabitans sp.]